MKKKKVLFLLGLFVTCIIMPLSNVAAAEQRYSSSVQIYQGSTLTGSGRSYSYENHKISFYPTSFYEVNGTGGKAQVTLQRKGLLFYSDAKEVTLTMSTLKSTYTKIMGSHSTGTFRYNFTTGSASNPTGGFVANPVYMYSYT